MKAKYLSLAALALMGALASCQSDDDFTVARPDNAVSVNFSVGSLQGTTRSNAIATDDTQREFNQGDQISVSTNDQEAVIFQCTSTENQTWTEATAGKFLLWTQPTLTFSAYYPATTGTSMTAFTVPTDQSSVEKIALADYMTRQQNISRPEGGSEIQMQLERKMARVIVRISGFGSQYFDDQKTVSNVRIYSEASGIEEGNPTGSNTEIQPYAPGNGGQGSTYTALVVPGYGDSGATFIQLTDGEGSTLLVKGIPELEAGYSYTFNLTVGKNRIEVASVTVTDWATGATLAGGQAKEQGAPATDLSVIWNSTDISSIGLGGSSIEIKGITLACDDHAWFSDSELGSAFGNISFTSSLGKIKKIEINHSGNGMWSNADGWPSNYLEEDGTFTWEGTPTETVNLPESNGGSEMKGITSIVFTIEPTEQTATARALAEATTDDIGKIAGADGNIYDTKAAAEAVATGNAVAMIAYVGSASDCTHGLAIALADESGTKTWSEAGAACSGKTAVTGGTWRLPSIKDWQYMFIGCGASGSYSDIPGTMSYSELDTKLTTANGTALQTASYWSSTESSPGEDAWSLYFGGGSASFFDGDYEGGAYPIRACLAF